MLNELQDLNNYKAASNFVNEIAEIIRNMQI